MRPLLTILVISFTFTPAISIYEFNIQLPELILLICTIVFILTSLVKVNQNKKIFNSKTDTSLVVISLIFILHSIIVTYYSYNVFYSFKGLIKWVSGFVIILVFRSAVHKPTHFIKLFYRYYNFLIVYLFVILLSFVIGILPFSLSGLSGFSLHSNALGQFSAIAFSMTLPFVLIESHDRKKFTMFIFLIMCAIVTTLSYNKTAMISLFLILPFTILMIYKEKDFSYHMFKLTVSFLVTAGAVAITIAIGILVFFSPRIIQLTQMASNPFKYKTMVERIFLWEQAIDLGMSYPFHGLGFYNSVLFLYDFQGNNILHAHNIFFEILISSGILGLAIFLVLIFIIIRSCYSILKATTSPYKVYAISLYNAILIYLLTNSISGSFSPRTHWYFWTSVALMICLQNFEDKRTMVVGKVDYLK